MEDGEMDEVMNAVIVEDNNAEIDRKLRAFYNMASKTVGLVGLWDCVAFDEVAGITFKEAMQEILTYSLEMRRRVKEQLKKIGGMEFYDVNFSYIDNESFEEHYVPVPEQGGGKIIPEGLTNPGNVYTVSQGKSGMIGVYRLETQMLTANGNTISHSLGTTTRDFIVNYQDLNGIGMTKCLTLPTVIALASSALNKPTLSSLAVLGEISISGTIMKVEELASASLMPRSSATSLTGLELAYDNCTAFFLNSSSYLVILSS
jgi:predicted ATP-dependent Lon-type protease